MDSEFNKKSNSGQSVFEILIAVAIATLIIGSSVTATIVSLRSGAGGTNSQRAYAIANETINNVRSYAEANWSDLYAPPPGNDPDVGKDGTTQYRFAVVSTTTESTILGIATGTNAVVFASTSTGENITYTSWFTIADVNRTTDNWIGSGYRDPTTLKITAKVSWSVSGQTNTIDLVAYISKIRSKSFSFDDWGGLSGATSPLTGSTRDYYAIEGNATITTGGDITIY